MSDAADGRETKELLGELEARVKDLTDRNRAAVNVVRTLGTFMRDGGEIPHELAMAIGGCLLEYVDCEGNCSDPNIKLLHDEIDKAMNW